MTQEQKAKAYDKFANKLRGFLTQGVDPLITREDVQDFFPELAESEDERMIREIKRYIKEQGDKPSGLPNGTAAVNDMLSWLEKQGESPSEIHYWTEEEIEPIISDYLRGAEHYGGMIGRLRCLKPKSLEKKEIDYAEELKKCKDNPLYFFDKYMKVKLKEQKPAWSEEDEHTLKGIVDEIEANKSNAPDYDLPTYDRFLSWLKDIRNRLK